MEERIVFGKSMFQEKMDENRFGFDAQFRATTESDPLAVHKFMRREAWELKGLHDLCQWLVDRGCNMGLCIEVGSFMGESALVFAQYFDAVICVDPFEFVGPGFDENIDNLNQAGLSKDIVRQGFRDNTSAVNNIALIEKPDSAVNLRADIVYIDSEHTFVACLTAINSWKDKVTWVTGHDYVCADVKLAVDSVGKAVVFEDHSWVLER